MTYSHRLTRRERRRLREERRSRRSRPPTFAEALVLGGVRDATAAAGSPTVSADDAFAAVVAGLKRNYRGPALTFDRDTFDAAARGLTLAYRQWVKTRESRVKNLAPSVRLTAMGAVIAAQLPTSTGSPLGEADLLLRFVRATQSVRKKRDDERQKRRDEKQNQFIDRIIAEGLRRGFEKWRTANPELAKNLPPLPPPIKLTDDDELD